MICDDMIRCLNGTLREVLWSGDPGVLEKLFVRGAATDSRKVRAGNIFICLRGERVDGHEFALAAVQAGASAILAERDPFDGTPERLDANSPGCSALPPIFVVTDVIRALWRLAVCHRSQAGALVVGITGTAGKTSVKEVLAAVLAQHGTVARNPMNLNNQIGLPVSMLNADADVDFWVMEAGISEVRDMDELGDILRPDLAVVLNAGEGHTQGLGDKGVAHYKAKLLRYLTPGGAGFVSADYPALVNEASIHAAELAEQSTVIRFFSAAGQSMAVEAASATTLPVFCRATYIGPALSAGGAFRVVVNDEELLLEAPFRGSLGAENVAAIVSVAYSLGLTQNEMQRGFSTAVLPAQRFACENVGAFTVVDDSYNANPLSSGRMLEVVASMATEAGQPLILVMGEMRELGEGAHRSHIALGVQMAAARPSVIFWKGEHADAVRQGLHDAGYAERFYPVGGGQEFSALLDELGLERGLILFKGSRGNYLERLVALFRECALSSGESDAV